MNAATPLKCDRKLLISSCRRRPSIQAGSRGRRGRQVGQAAGVGAGVRYEQPCSPAARAPAHDGPDCRPASA
jgi:hypothetical protein